MKSLPTQFDDDKLASTVATPTCGGCCCCCCCCLATSLTSSALLAEHVNNEGKKHRIPHLRFYTSLAALYVPIFLALVALMYLMIEVLKIPSINLLDMPYVPVVYVLLLLWFLYSRIQTKHAFVKAILVTLLIAAAFMLEILVGMYLLLTGLETGGLAFLYPLLAIATFVLIYRWHRKRSKGEDGEAEGVAASAPDQLVRPATVKPTEQDEEDSTTSQRPPE